MRSLCPSDCFYLRIIKNVTVIVTKKLRKYRLLRYKIIVIISKYSLRKGLGSVILNNLRELAWKLLKRRVAVRAAVIIIIVSMVSVLWIQNENEYVNNRVTRLGYINTALASQIESKIRNEVYLAEILKIMVNTDEKKTLENFYEIADKFHAEQPELSSIRLAPGGVVKYIYPMIGNTDKNLNLFEAEDRKDEALETKESGQLRIVGPLTLGAGGLGIVARAPIYDEDTGEFWGFSIISVRVDKLLNSLESFNSITDVYYCKIWREKNDKQEVIWTNATKDSQLKRHTEKTIDLIDGSIWHMEMSPKGGWISDKKLVKDALFAVFNMILLIAFALYFVNMMQKNMTLNLMVKRDALTKLLNKRALMDDIDELNKEKSPYGIMYIDVDKFKDINDTYGHNVGDIVLKEVAERLRKALRNGDNVYRYGGDEFVAILSGNLSPETITTIIERVRKNVNEKIFIDEASLTPFISVGFAKSSEFENSDVEAVINLADGRMYMDKTLNYEKYS